MFDRNLLDGKVALITGGGSGLGLATCKAYLNHGAKVAILGRREEVLTKSLKEIGVDSDRAISIRGDVRFQDEIDAAIERCIEHFGGLDILFNNAAANFVSPSENLSSGACRLILDTVLSGTLNFTLSAGRYWIKNNRPGTVLNTLTTYANTGSGYVLPSSMAKAAIANMIYSLAAEWGKYQIRLLGIAPGPFPTEGAIRQLRLDQKLFENISTDEFVNSRIPMGRSGMLDEFSNLALFLVSPAAEFINGEIIRIDGGEIPWLSGEFNFLDQMPPNFWQSSNKSLNRRK